jgi:hypothetical protein
LNLPLSAVFRTSDESAFDELVLFVLFQPSQQYVAIRVGTARSDPRCDVRLAVDHGGHIAFGLQEIDCVQPDTPSDLGRARRRYVARGCALGRIERERRIALERRGG